MRTVIFGLGGVLIDSEKHWQEDQKEFFREFGKWTKEDQAQTIGADINRLFKYARAKGFQITFDEIQEMYDELDRRVYGKECQLYPGVRERLRELGRSYELVLATSTRRKNLDLVMDRFDLHDLFAIAVCTDDVSVSKPSPNIYLHAARELGIAPRECIVVDDSDHGITSAQEAGMVSIGIRGTPGQTLSDAQIVLDSVADITREMIEEPWEHEA